MTVTIGLAPCETIALTESHNLGNDGNRGTNVKVTYLNSAGQQIHSETFWGFYSGSRNFPQATPWPFPWRGSRSANVLPLTLKIESINAYGQGNPPSPPSYSFTISRVPRPGYNIGGDSFSNALFISSLPSSYKGSVYNSTATPVDPGQYFRVSLDGNKSMWASGTAEGSTAYGASYRIDVYNSSQQLLTTYGWVNVAAYGVKTYSSQAFTNPNSTASDFYIRVKSVNWPVYDFTMNLLTVKADIASLNSVAKNGTASVAVTVSPASNQTPITLTLGTLNGTGEARFADDSTTMTITQSTTVQINGITESSAIDNIRLESKVNDLVSDTEDFTVVTTDKLQYQSGSSYVDVSGPLYELKGTTVTFKAVAQPSGAAWPSGKPVWGGTAGASGTGATKAITFNTASSDTSDYKTVTVECGDTVTANVIVYELNGVLTPQDNFSGRSSTQYGIAEQVSLSFNAIPAITAAQAGGLTWKVISGSGTTTVTDDGISTYTAPATAGTATLKLEVISGPSKGLGPTYSREIVAPTGAYMRQKPGTIVAHDHGVLNVYFIGEAFLLPKDVSFQNLGFAEGEATAIASGYYAANNGEVHTYSGPFNVTGCNITTGCKAFEDLVGVLSGDPPFTNGDFLWPIPWLYLVDANTPGVQFFTANHHNFSTAYSTTNADVTIEKAGAGPFTKNVNDPTTGTNP